MGTRKKLDLEVQRNASDLSDQEREMQKDDLEAEVKRHMDTKAILQQEQADHEKTRQKLDMEVQRNNQDAKPIDTKPIVEEEAIQLSGADELQDAPNHTSSETNLEDNKTNEETGVIENAAKTASENVDEDTQTPIKRQKTVSFSENVEQEQVIEEAIEDTPRLHQEISSYNDLNQQNGILGEGIDPHLHDVCIQVLDQEKEDHRLTKEELENEISNHIVNKKELEKEISSHSATKKDLEDEIEKYIAIKVELEQIGTTAEQQPNVEFVQTAHKPVETSSAKRELDEEDKSKSVLLQDDLNKEKEVHDATKNKLNYETSNHKCTMNELDQEKNDNSSTKKIIKLEKDSHQATRKVLELERNAHSSTKTELFEEIEKHVATKFEFDKHIEGYNAARDEVELLQLEMDREKGSHNSTKNQLKKEKDLHNVTKSDLEKEKDGHETTKKELDQRKKPFWKKGSCIGPSCAAPAE